MPYVSTNGIRLAYERVGHGERMLMIMGQAAAVYEASVAALPMFSPATLDDDAAISGWLDIYEMSAARRSAASGQDARLFR